jgi:hypothetical protein
VKAVESALDQSFPLFATDSTLKPLAADRLGSTLGTMSTVYFTDVFVSVNVKPKRQKYALGELNVEKVNKNFAHMVCRSSFSFLTHVSAVIALLVCVLGCRLNARLHVDNCL